VSSSERERFEVILESIETKIGVLADGHLALNEKFDRLEGKFDRLEVKVDHLEIKVNHLEGKVDHLASDVASLRTDLGSVKRRVGKIEHHLGLNGVSTAGTTKSTIRKLARRKPR